MNRFIPALAAFLLSTLAVAHAADTASIEKRVAPCMTCHGKQGRAASDGYYPRIAGKPAGYLYNQLLNFRDGRRTQYAQMTYMVQYLSDDYLREMAEYFSSLHVPYPPPVPVEATKDMLDKGHALVTKGDPSRKIPACIACHGEALTGLVPSIPGLLGLPRDYINAQFGGWREGTRHSAAPDCMGHIAQTLRADEISAVSAWLASQNVPADASPSTANVKLPVACGSVPQEAK
ncbi:MAG TPA: cytochrome c4 [Noviherbaspirillum sp.]